MTLFTDVERSFHGAKPYAEPDFEYLDRSARPEAAAIRCVLTRWFAEYPDSEKRDLLGRFQSPDSGQHVSAAFELYLYTLFHKLGCKLVPHPETQAVKATRPDFLVRDPSGVEFYLEAVQSIERSTLDQAAQQRIDVVYDTINRLDSRNFFVAVDPAGVPHTPPPGRRLRNSLKRWLKRLDPDALIPRVMSEGNSALPSLDFEHDGWRLTFTAIPRSPEKRHSPAGAVIGLISEEARWLNTREGIRDSLLSKGGHYGELDLPLLIAVNATVTHLDRIDIMEALFGQEQFVFRASEERQEPEMSRASNGFWNGPKGIRYRRVSGVLIGFDVKPWAYGVRDLTYYMNPSATREVCGSLAALPRAMPEEGKMTWVDGTHPKEILELPDTYPGVQ
jgi:hypothetical protein